MAVVGMLYGGSSGVKVVRPPGYRHGDVVTTIDQWELHTLKTIALRWTNFVNFLAIQRKKVEARDDCQGPSRVGVTIMRPSLNTEISGHTYVETHMVPEELLGLEK